MTDKKTTLNIEELKAKYGKVYTIKATLVEEDEKEFSKAYAFKKPTTASYDRFIKNASNSPNKASKAFVLDNVVEEQRPQMEADLEEYPAMTMSIIEKLLAMLGLSKDITVKKL